MSFERDEIAWLCQQAYAWREDNADDDGCRRVKQVERMLLRQVAARRELVEEVARWLRETFPNGAGPADAQSAVASQHAREYLATLLQRRFGAPEEKPEGQP